MRRLIAVVILLAVAAATWAYDPPTDEELAGWWEGLTRDERLSELRKLDEIEHAVPVLEEPQLVVIQTKAGAISAYFTGPLGIDIAGHLQYEIELPEVETQGNRDRNVLAWFGAGFAAGAVAALVIAILAP